MRAAAVDSEDAFDALVSALEMWRHRYQLATLPAARDGVERLEGAIWFPDGIFPSPHTCGEGAGGEE
jgi:hypothetical protein